MSEESMKWMKILSLLVMAILLAGCSTGVPPEMRELMMGTEDIPQEWVIYKEGTAKDWGGTLYNVAFAYGNESTDPALEHQLIVYADEAAAEKGFEEYNAYMFVEEWTQPAESKFIPSSSADRFEYKCVTREIEHVMLTNCFALQLHGHFVSALGVQLGGPLMFEVVDEVLKGIDGKLGGE